MTIVSFLSRHRRVFALCAATAILHLATIDWLGARLGPQYRSRPQSSVVTAQLRLALPARSTTVEAAPELKPIDPAVPKPRRPARPSAASAAQAAPAETDSGALSASAIEAPAEPVEPPEADKPAAVAVQQDAAPSPAVVPSVPEAAPGVAVKEGAPPPPMPQSTRRYKVNLPPSAEFEMELKRTDADGTKWNGVGAMAWQTDGSRYTLKMEAGISMLVTRVNLLVLNSEGEIDDAGIAPSTFTEKRRSRAQTATHFNRADGRITFSASERNYPLLTGAQDKASVPFQLAAIGRADVNQFGSAVDILVGDDKDANIFRFQLIGEEELDTRMGRIVTWHLSRPPRPGSYSARLDIWLAPSLNWYPLQIRNTEANGALTTQTVTKITMSDTSGK
ncbi:MAG: DUF3108 domain-containing protein [Pseudomonadota bacterium]